MALIFGDSYDNYTDLTSMYDAVGGGALIDTTGTKSRTGDGCLVLTQAFGPSLNFPGHSGTGGGNGIVAGAAYYQPGVEDSTSGGIFKFYEASSGQDLVWIGVDGSLAIKVVNQLTGTLGSSAAGVVTASVYNYIEMKVFFHAVNGSVTVRVNGVQVLSLTNINTLNFGAVVGSNITLNGPGGLSGARFDDFYLLDTSGTSNNDFLGEVRLYPIMPSANSTPLQWTPLAGSNFSEVNQIPPPGDASYVSDGTVGQIDQYIYDPSPVPANVVVFGAVHLMDAKQASGSGSIASCVNGTAAAGVALGSVVYHFSVKQPYDTNPHTGNPWTLADFPSTVLGPKVTA